ncbi:MAG: esterase [Verrucomicrobiales bacterium]|nr:esterase [Verrucomicrobiales bacterium]
MNPNFRKKPLLLAVVALCVLACCLPPLQAGIERRAWTVDGVEREAMVYIPEGKETSAKAPSGKAAQENKGSGDESPEDEGSEKAVGRPLVFVFHGHGGSMAQAVRSLPIHIGWPEAVCVWPQGLPTPGKLTDPEGKRNGWQMSEGDQGNRDLKFYDAMLKDLLTGGDHVDAARVFALGHSNGGAFTYLLWAERPDTLSAVAPSGAVAAKTLPKLKLHPKPMLAIAGREDPLVRFSWQERMIQSLLRSNGCTPPPLKNGLTDHPSPTQTPIRTLIHHVGHAIPREATPEIANFFQSLPTPPPNKGD